MERAYFGFSFDDGRMDHFTMAYPVLQRYGLSATFNVTASYIEQRQTEWPFTEVPPMTIDMLRQLHGDPRMEIASHGYWHHNATDNLLDGIEKLCEWLGTDRLHPAGNGIALTGNTCFATDEERLFCNNRGISVRYIRHSIRRPSPFWLKTISRKIDRIVPSPSLYRYAFGDSLMHEGDGARPGTGDAVIRRLYSIPIVGNKPLADMKALIEKAIANQAACIFMLHSIVADGHRHDAYEMELGRFQRLCDFLAQCQKESLLKVDTCMAICQIMDGCRKIPMDD